MFLEAGGIFENLINGLNAWTGSEFLTYLFMILILILLAFALGWGLEWTAIIILPLLFTLMAYDNSFYPIGAVILVYIAFFIGYIMFKR